MEFKPTNSWIAITKLTFLRQPILKLGPGRTFSSSSAGMWQVSAKGEGIEKGSKWKSLENMWYTQKINIKTSTFKMMLWKSIFFSTNYGDFQCPGESLEVKWTVLSIPRLSYKTRLSTSSRTCWGLRMLEFVVEDTTNAVLAAFSPRTQTSKSSDEDFRSSGLLGDVKRQAIRPRPRSLHIEAGK